VSDLYEFQAIRDLALKKILKKNDVRPSEKLRIGRRFSGRSLIVNGLTGLINRKETLTANELKKLSSTDIAFIIARREKLRSFVTSEEEIIRLTEKDVATAYNQSLPDP